MQSDKKMMTYLLVFLGFMLIIFFTKGAYSDLQLELSEKKTHQEKLEKLQSEKTKLNRIQKEMKDPENTTRQAIQRYTGEFTEDKLLNYFYRFSESSNGKLIVQGMNLNAKDINEYGFREGFVNLNLSVSDTGILLNFLRDILSENAEYRFFIDRINIPEQQEGRNLQLTVPLKIFYN